MITDVWQAGEEKWGMAWDATLGGDQALGTRILLQER